MADLVFEKVEKLYKERVIDNREVTMAEAFPEVMQHTTTFDMAVGYFYVSGFELVETAFTKLMENPNAVIRVLMGNQTNTSTIEVLKAGLTPKKAVLNDIASFEEEQIDILYKVIKWIRAGRFHIKVYTGDANYFHAKSYLFQEDTYGLKGSAIVGSSNFSKSGLSGNTELNTLSEDNFRALKKWFSSIWDSNEVQDFAPELIKAVDEKLPKPEEKLTYYRPALATYIEFAKMYAKPPLEIGTDGFWTNLYPHQKTGVAECVNRIKQYGTALLCDGVGLGKTRTAAGVIQEMGTPKTLLIVATKLHEQWHEELAAVGVSEENIEFMSKESLARMDAASLRNLASFELIIIDEAHQGFRNSGRKMYRNLQYVIEHTKHSINGLLLTATPWNNSRSDVFHLGRLFLVNRNVPLHKSYREYLRYAPRKAGKAFEMDDKAFESFWEDLFLQRTRKTYGGEEVTFATRQFPTVEIVYEPKKQQALEDNFERISSLSLPYMDPLRYLDGAGDDFTSDRLKLLFLKRADSSWIAFKSTLDSIDEKVRSLAQTLEVIEINEEEITKNFRTFIAKSYGIDQSFEDIYYAHLDSDEDLTEFEMNSRAKRARYVKRMTERIETITKSQAKKVIRDMLTDARADVHILKMIREDLSEAFDRKDEKYEAVRDALVENINKGEKVLIISQFRDTTISYFNRFITDPKVKDVKIGHVSGSAEDCYVGKEKNKLSKESILTRFAPVAKNVIEFVGSEDELDVVIGTETLSIGQNLQDSKVIMNLDLPYNPMVLEQRIGRIDRPRQSGQVHEINIYTFPSIPVIEAELKMTERLRVKLEGIFQDTRFDDLVLPEYEDYLRKVLKERGKAVQKMLDDTVERTIVPVNAKTHSADYVKAQERMWSFINRDNGAITENTVYPSTSFSTGEVTDTVVVANTILRDINGHTIDSVRYPLMVQNMEADLVNVESTWHKAIAHSVLSSQDLSVKTAEVSLEKQQEKLQQWTKIQVDLYNKETNAKNEVDKRLISSKSKSVAVAILSAVRGENRTYISEQIISAGYAPNVLRKLTSSIEYIDTRDPEYIYIEDLHEDLSRLWNDFGYYAERLLEAETHFTEIESEVPQRSGRQASLKKSETIWELGHVNV